MTPKEEKKDEQSIELPFNQLSIWKSCYIFVTTFQILPLTGTSLRSGVVEDWQEQEGSPANSKVKGFPSRPLNDQKDAAADQLPLSVLHPWLPYNKIESKQKCDVDWTLQIWHFAAAYGSRSQPTHNLGRRE